MMQLAEVQALFQAVQTKKSDIERKNGILSQMKAERDALEKELVAKYGPNYAQVIAASLAQMQTWVASNV